MVSVLLSDSVVCSFVFCPLQSLLLCLLSVIKPIVLSSACCHVRCGAGDGEGDWGS